MAETVIERTKIFISYSHQDAEWLKRLRVHLKPLERRYRLEVWADTDIKPGAKWRAEIEKALAAAKVAILLISADFVASDFVESNELPPLLRAAEAEGTVILLLILSPSMFSRLDHLEQFQAVNDPSRPMVGLSRIEQEAILVQLSEAVEDAFGYVPTRTREDPVKGPTKTDRRGIVEPATPLIRKMSPAVWVGIIGTLVAILAYWQFVYKPREEDLATYSGRVTDSLTYKAIPNAKVMVQNSQNGPQIQFTDSEGVFRVTMRETSGALIIVETEGYSRFDGYVSFARTGIEPINLIALPSASPTPSPLPSPSLSPRRIRKGRICPAEDRLLGKC